MDEVPIIDSHIHLYPESALDTLAWCSPDHPLRGQHSVDEYLSATVGDGSLRGFVFVETDRKSHLDSDRGWEQPLAETDWITRIVAGTPKPGEGHSAEHSHLCLAFVPWAPVPLGAVALSRYVEQVKMRAGHVSDRITGFRYLVQDKPKSTMLQPGFIEGLRWLGKRRYTFDLGVDQRSGGLWQLDEAIEMVHRAHDGLPEDEKVTVVINHMCKPDMGSSLGSNTNFQEWAARIDILAAFSKTFMKISGAFSEIEPLPTQAEQEAMEFCHRSDMLRRNGVHIEFWLGHIRDTFGSQRMMFGSDWPVCNIGGGGNPTAWKYWWSIVRSFITAAGLNEVDERAIWGGTAAKVYRIPLNEP